MNPRQLAAAARRALPDRDARSLRIAARVESLAEFANARVIAAYCGVRDEVQTDSLLQTVLAAGKQLLLPFCDGDDLRLVRIERLDELSRGRFGIPEPNESSRAEATRLTPAAGVDLFLVPGVAFDEQGHRLGHGRGFYDRLLSRSRPEAMRVGLAFDCQLVSQIVPAPHDVPMEVVVTESRIWRRSIPVPN